VIVINKYFAILKITRLVFKNKMCVRSPTEQRDHKLRVGTLASEDRLANKQTNKQALNSHASSAQACEVFEMRRTLGSAVGGGGWVTSDTRGGDGERVSAADVWVTSEWRGGDGGRPSAAPRE
jgi:hypothetical protein